MTYNLEIESYQFDAKPDAVFGLELEDYIEGVIGFEMVPDISEDQLAFLSQYADLFKVSLNHRS